jgi:hypothetical protein
MGIVRSVGWHVRTYVELGGSVVSAWLGVHSEELEGLGCKGGGEVAEAANTLRDGTGDTIGKSEAGGWCVLLGVDSRSRRQLWRWRDELLDEWVVRWEMLGIAGPSR